MAPILGYWKIRGLAQSIRLVLEYGGEKYTDKMYQPGPPPNYDKSFWLSVKSNLGLKLPNLPYYIDGNVKLTQSQAILRHLGRKFNLCGQTEKERVMVDMLLEQAKDMRLHFSMLCYFTYSPEKKKEYLDTLPNTLKLLSKILGNQEWFAGDKITLADFLLYEELDVNLALDSTCLDNFQNLKDFMKRFENIPVIQKYMASPRFMKSPLNFPLAKFNA